MKTLQKGFTLIELMIVVAIVGILAAIALPAYQDYIARAKQSEPLAKLDELKLSIAEYVASNNITPGTGTQAGLGGDGPVTTGFGSPSYYKAVGYQDATPGVLVRVGVQLNGAAKPALDDAWLVMEGSVDSASGTVSWTCGTTLAAAATEKKYLPANCRTTKTFTPG